jgi:hypothetical protein
MKENEENESKIAEDFTLFGGHFKGKFRNRESIGYKTQDCKGKNWQNGGNIWRGIVLKWKIEQVKVTVHQLTMGIMATMTGETSILRMSLLYQLLNSGSCGQYCHFVEGLRNIKDINEQITIGNGHTILATKSGDLKRDVTQLNGSNYLPEMWTNLLITNKALKNGFKLSNDSVLICLEKGPVWLCFDCIIPTSNGFVTGRYLQCYS